MLIVNEYSAKVKLTLAVAGLEIALSQVCAGTAYLRDACDPILTPIDGKLYIEVDGNQIVRYVSLPKGITTFRVEYTERRMPLAKTQPLSQATL